MGFAVVAEEVRGLAQRSAAAAKETASKIQDSIVKSQKGVEICRQVDGVFQDIMLKVRNLDELIARIAAASNEQRQGINQVNTAVNEIDKVTQSNAASAEQSASAAAELLSQADALRSPIGELMRLMSGSDKSSTSLAPGSVARV